MLQGGQQPVVFLLSDFVCPGSASGQQQVSLQPDPEIVNQLVGMGFSENGSKRAAVATQVSSMSLLWLSWHASLPLAAHQSIAYVVAMLHTCLHTCAHT